MFRDQISLKNPYERRLKTIYVVKIWYHKSLRFSRSYLVVFTVNIKFADL